MNLEDLNNKVAENIIAAIAKYIAADMLSDGDALYAFLGEDFIDSMPLEMYQAIQERISVTGLSWIKQDVTEYVQIGEDFPSFVEKLMSKHKQKDLLLSGK